jgi:hypothetical protein
MPKKSLFQIMEVEILKAAFAAGAMDYIVKPPNKIVIG